MGATATPLRGYDPNSDLRRSSRAVWSHRRLGGGFHSRGQGQGLVRGIRLRPRGWHCLNTPIGTLSAIALLDIGARAPQASATVCSEESWQFGKYRFFAFVEQRSSSSGSFSRPWPGLLFAMRNLVGGRALK